MAREEYAGGAVETTLASGIGTSDTSFTITDATGWPTGATGKFVVTLGRDTATQEKVLCTARSGTTVTGVTRGHDGTSAQTHSAGAAAEHTISASKFDDLDDHVYDTGRDDHTQYLDTTRHNVLDHSTALGTAVIADLSDVDATSPSSGQSLVWDGDSWAPTSPSARAVIGGFVRTTNNPDGTPVRLGRLHWDGSTPVALKNVSVVMPRAGSITGVMISTPTARTAGSLSVEVYKNGVATGLAATLDGTFTEYGYATQAPGADTFVAGDKLDLWVTNSSYSPADTLEGLIEVAFT